MAERARKLEDQTAQKTIHFLKQLLCDYHPRGFTIELWDGTRWEPDTEKGPHFIWRINNPAILHAVTVSASQLALAEGYIYDDFDIEGDIEAVFPLADYLLNKRWSTKEKLRLRALLLGFPTRHQSRRVRPLAALNGPAHSKKRDRRAVSYHYDVSNDFYTLWLGKEMVYSGAYFRTPDDDLDTAQKQKLDLICRKLRLKPGERFLDIGCGWGGLVIHAAREYGVQALGITLSEQQLELAKKRIHEAGLSDRCEVRLLDYRDLGVPGTYDKVASVGMVEHVASGWAFPELRYW
jgi:cyclopropane-fatty-acyl-phospholipid synthase